MRPTGQLHLGHLVGVLEKWREYQYRYDCFYFIADWHAITTQYDDLSQLKRQSLDVLAGWIAAGIDPAQTTIFRQSDVPAHAALYVVLSMICPLPWLERIPTYREQKQQIADKNLNTFGFLGYPLLQSADILLYRTQYVPIGEDQLAHIEFTREIARRFNYFYGRSESDLAEAEAAIEKLGAKKAEKYKKFRQSYQQEGDRQALEAGKALVESERNLTNDEMTLLYSFLEGGGREILPPPEAKLSQRSRLYGLDGRKMSKSYDNCIYIDDTDVAVREKVSRMLTDPNRKRRHDAGDPDKCNVYSYHKIYSSSQQSDDVAAGCRSAHIGCVDCKKMLAGNMVQSITPVREQYCDIRANTGYLADVLEAGAKRAQQVAQETMDSVDSAMSN